MRTFEPLSTITFLMLSLGKDILPSPPDIIEMEATH